MLTYYFMCMTASFVNICIWIERGPKDYPLSYYNTAKGFSIMLYTGYLYCNHLLPEEWKK